MMLSGTKKKERDGIFRKKYFVKSFTLKKIGKVYTPKLYPLQNKSLCIWSGFTPFYFIYFQVLSTFSSMDKNWRWKLLIIE